MDGLCGALCAAEAEGVATEEDMRLLIDVFGSEQ